MNELERIQSEYQRIEQYDGPDKWGALMASMDWRIEERILMQELQQRTIDAFTGRHEYQRFLASKDRAHEPCGFTVQDVNPRLMHFQKDIVQWALRRGRAAIFSDCGTGKGWMAMEWAYHVAEHTQKPTVIFAPLAVAQQFRSESIKFGIADHLRVCESSDDVGGLESVTNYDKLHRFSPSAFGGIVCDESSLIKSQDGKTRKALMDFCADINYRLACTATPSPNDYMELGSHAEFLGVMRHVEMLSLFFVHDGGETSKWRIKGHAEIAFWKWVCSWAVAIRKPSDLGYDDGDFKLPPLRMHQITVPAERPCDGYLFPVEAKTLDERRSARRNSIDARVEACAELAIKSEEPWLIWCNLNAESEAVSKAISDAVEVTGSDTNETKESQLLGFIAGEHRVLVTKPLIAGFGLNLQHCSKVAFLGLSDSYEQLYQAIRRCWRFGQKNPVDVYVITAETEGAVVRNIERKEKQAMEMMEEMVRHMKTEMQKEVRGLVRESSEYEVAVESGRDWTMHLGDCVETIAAMESESVDFSVFSPPFASLYTYSNSDRDMGNSTDAEFWEHFQFLIPELYRVLKPGRLLSFHCMNLPSSKERDGVIGIKDFRGQLIRAFMGGDFLALRDAHSIMERRLFAELAKPEQDQDAERILRLKDACYTTIKELREYTSPTGFIYHSEVTIWKDPVTAMQRTKALGLLYKQLRKDSCMSRQGIPDYLVTMRKPGVNPDPVTKTHESFPVDLWQRYASPVWMDINPSDTLQRESAREEDDERHICPLQLSVIERAIELWSNPRDLVLSPFAGIGSEGHVALNMGRRFVGVELKRSYFDQAVRNLKIAENGKQSLLFGEHEPA